MLTWSSITTHYQCAERAIEVIYAKWYNRDFSQPKKGVIYVDSLDTNIQEN
jgi:hypothetical protein